MVCRRFGLFFTDASRKETLGFGFVFDKEWTFGQWPKNFIADFKPSIEFLELFAVAVGVHLWVRKLGNRRVWIYCDNLSVVHMINNSSASCEFCMKLIRGIILVSLQFNVRVFAKHVPANLNVRADALSRLQFSRFWTVAKSGTRQYPAKLPNNLWPPERF